MGGGKKKVVDPFTKKDWYSIKAPAVFKVRNVGHTLVTRTIGNKIAADGLKGRVYDCNQADLNDDGAGHRKFKLVCEDVQGKNCILNFHGMSLTRDKMCGMVKKWQTMIQCAVDAKTTDNYHLRVFVVAFTKKQSQGQLKTATSAKSRSSRSQNWTSTDWLNYTVKPVLKLTLKANESTEETTTNHQ